MRQGFGHWSYPLLCLAASGLMVLRWSTGLNSLIHCISENGFIEQSWDNTCQISGVSLKVTNFIMCLTSVSLSRLLYPPAYSIEQRWIQTVKEPWNVPMSEGETRLVSQIWFQRNCEAFASDPFISWITFFSTFCFTQTFFSSFLSLSSFSFSPRESYILFSATFLLPLPSLLPFFAVVSVSCENLHVCEICSRCSYKPK